MSVAEEAGGMNKSTKQSDPRKPLDERRLTVKETSKALGLAEVTVRDWIARRRIGYVRLGRAIRIPESEIQELIEAGTVPRR